MDMLKNMDTTITRHRETCSCGDHADHVMARRKTADGIIVQIWSDGAVTCGMNTYVVRGARAPYARRKAIEAAWLVANVVEMYDHAELRKLAVTARKAVTQVSQAPARYLTAVMEGVKFAFADRHKAVICHASDCTCARCIARRAINLARPEAERCYVEIPLANGGSSFVRVR